MRKKLITLIACFAAVTFAAAQTDTTTLTRIGDKAPVFTCLTIDGKTIDISKLQGKVVMINFFATWCGPCNLELPVLQKNIWDKYKANDNFELIILGRQHNETEVRNFVQSKKFTMPRSGSGKEDLRTLCNPVYSKKCNYRERWKDHFPKHGIYS